MTTRAITNWSETRVTTVNNLFTPKTFEEVKAILKENFEKAQKRIRPFGSNMSPSGIAACDEVMIGLGNFDRVLSVDPKSETVRVEPGVRIEQLLHALATHKLTLPNLPSTTGMTMGGLIQASCHGTGVNIGPLNDAVVELTLIKADGEEMSLDKSHKHFTHVICGLGMFGVVKEITLRCRPMYYLKETIAVMGMEEIKKEHVQRIQKHMHVKYHFIPFTKNDMAVVYVYDEVDEAAFNKAKKEEEGKEQEKKWLYQKQSLLDMLFRLLKSKDDPILKDDFIKSHLHWSFSQLRGAILAFDPLNTDFVKELNNAELEYWQRVQGSQIDISYKLLMFDCGGKQLVKEFTMPVHKDMDDLKCVEAMLRLIDERRIPAPVPIEQRWSCGSVSALSPVFAASEPEKKLFSWIGIVQYFANSLYKDIEIENAFDDYYNVILAHLGEKYELEEHLAKTLITPSNADSMAKRLRRMEKRLKDVKIAREEFDPKRIFVTDDIRGIIDIN